ncbi:hypothetical protein MU852_03405 [Brevundimonas albigilva]|uniref:hypothetical protein n=1 Tax=Brevundimonas albigilva TaxID=1312364 RepID=UPI00201B56E2|nr:hypothetical protein [Brevundimonas albigilva]UQV18929.1 hypothetical protein MU852_03405 [Brevundimonas albigilva]
MADQEDRVSARRDDRRVVLKKGGAASGLARRARHDPSDIDLNHQRRPLAGGKVRRQQQPARKGFAGGAVMRHTDGLTPIESGSIRIDPRRRFDPVADVQLERRGAVRAILARDDDVRTRRQDPLSLARRRDTGRFCGPLGLKAA